LLIVEIRTDMKAGFNRLAHFWAQNIAGQKFSYILDYGEAYRPAIRQIGF
jgi:hypothetical protein